MSFFWGGGIYKFVHEEVSGSNLAWERNELARYNLSHPKEECCFTYGNTSYPATFYAFPRRFVEHLPKLYQDMKGVFTSPLVIMEGRISSACISKDLKRKRRKFKLRIIKPIDDRSFEVVGVNCRATASAMRSAFGSNPAQVLNVSPVRPDPKDREREVLEVLASTEIGFNRIRQAEELFEENDNEPKLSVIPFETPLGLDPLEKLCVYLISKKYLPEKKRLYQKRVVTIMTIRRELSISVFGMTILGDKSFARVIAAELQLKGYVVGHKFLQSIGRDIETVVQISPEMVKMQSSRMVVT